MKKMASLLVLALATFPAVAVAAGGGKIIHEPVSCVPAAGHGRVEASLAPGVTASSVRVYFRAEGARDEYYAEMRRNQPGRYWAVLPVVALGQHAILYRVVARETEGEFARTANLRVPVVAGCPVVLSEEESRFARNIVLGMTSAEQGDALAGFGCDGVVAKITSGGDLRTVLSCVAGTAIGSAGSVASSTGGTPNPGVAGTSGATAAPARPNSGTAGGLVIGGTQGTSAGVYGTPISSARPPR